MMLTVLRNSRSTISFIISAKKAKLYGRPEVTIIGGVIKSSDGLKLKEQDTMLKEI